ncbi:hypothetical protein [Aliivibrio kagoshimensis]|uniref:hypothetical protein n=1 Tax=Aliivibrio kagoshimensis TaxID=2910230 RepID=UPI003D0D2F9A
MSLVRLKARDDSSGKCDVINTKCSDDKMIGAILEIDEKEKVHLDRAVIKALLLVSKSCCYWCKGDRGNASLSQAA